jgi:hypothetical protein
MRQGKSQLCLYGVKYFFRNRTTDEAIRILYTMVERIEQKEMDVGQINISMMKNV